MSTADLKDLDSLDLSDPAVWDDGPPCELFARLQREAPVHFSPQAVAPDEGGFWSITRHEDVRTVTRDFKTFSSERRGIFLVDDIGVPLDVQRLQMISMDPPRHDRLKALVTKVFTPDRVAEHEGHISQIISDVLDRVADRERFDLVADVARPIPARVIGSMLGTPPEDDADARALDERVHRVRGPGDPRPVDRHPGDLHRDHRVRERARSPSAATAPRDDLITALDERRGRRRAAQRVRDRRRSSSC